MTVRARCVVAFARLVPSGAPDLVGEDRAEEQEGFSGWTLERVSRVWRCLSCVEGEGRGIIAPLELATPSSTLRPQSTLVTCEVRRMLLVL